MRIYLDIPRKLAKKHLTYMRKTIYKLCTDSHLQKYILIVVQDTSLIYTPQFRRLDIYYVFFIERINKHDLYYADYDRYNNGGGLVAAPVYLYHQLDEFIEDIYNFRVSHVASAAKILSDKIAALGGYFDYGQDMDRD